MRRQGAAFITLIAAASLLATGPEPAAGQAAAAGTAAGGAAIAGTDAPAEAARAVPSLGQPPRWKPFAALGLGASGLPGVDRLGATGSIGVYRDLLRPRFGLLGYSAVAYAGGRGGELDGGLRGYLGSPVLYLHAGVDWNARLGVADFVLSLQFPVVRGGWFGRGGEVRVDYVPARDHDLIVGVAVPVGEPLAGRTRPRATTVALPGAPAGTAAPPPAAGTPTAAALAELRASLDWLLLLRNLHWFADRSSVDHEETVAGTRARLAALRRALAEREAHLPGPWTYPREVERYHLALERAFGHALGAAGADAASRGRPLAAEARRLALDEVVLPYNRTIGQHKQPDTLLGLIARARERFIAWSRSAAGLGEAEAHAALQVLDAWLGGLEAARARQAAITSDSRMHWLPLAFVLRPEAHDSQEEVDAILERALETGFTGGNAVLYINAPQFQAELERSIHETATYHVLWVHDYRGGDRHDPDTVSFARTTHGYLRALLDRVRAYDRTGRLPVYIVLLDEYYYDKRHGRLWMDLLERPLTHRTRLAVPEMQRTIEALQDSLRAAVAASTRMQAEVAAFGPDWAERVVKVHVNVTYPSDPSFRSRRILGTPFDVDDLMRDHRKLVIRDVTAADPALGEVIVTGAGVGENYASATWEDRGLVIQGPAALAAKEEARLVLEAHGLRGRHLPQPLRPAPLAPDYAERVARLDAAGATARVTQQHNRTGFDDKHAIYLQMLLYDLAPAGTVIYVPSSLWTSREWMAQLVGAALRGGRVYLVAASARHTPQGLLVLSAMQELVTELVLVREQFGDLIGAAGGELRIGLYTREAPADDLPGRLAEAEAAFARYPFLAELFPFGEEAWSVIRAYAARPRPPAGRAPVADAPPAPLPGAENGPVLMHRKTQLLASGRVLRELARAPGMPEVLAGLLDQEREAVVPTESGPLHAQDRLRPFRRLLRLYRSLPAETREAAIIYLLTGSLNKDARSMALDGEIHVAVAGAWALQAFLDFFLLSGSVTWVETLAETEELLPPYSNFRRWIARFLEPVI